MTSAWVVAKEKGNTLFKGQSYLAAIEAYTEAISLHGQESAAASSSTEDASSPPPTRSRSDLAPLYSNRAVSHYKLGEYASAEADARRALDADPQFLRAYSRLGAALCGLGRFAAAAEVYLQGATEAARKKDRNLEAELRANAADATSVSQAMDAGRSALDGGVAAAGTPAGTPVTPLSPVAPMSPTTLATAGRLVGEAYLRHPTCPPLALMYAELQASVDPEAGTRVLARLGRGAAVDGTPDPRDAAAAEAAANRNLQNNPEYFYVRALTAYHAQASTTATAQAILREALSVDPDHGKSQRLLRRIRSLEAQKEAGNKAYKERNWKAAEEAYTNALNADASNKRLAGVLYGNRSAARLEGGNVAGALEDVNQALARGNESAKLYARRARIYEQQDKWTEAKSDLQKAAELDEENYGGRAMHDFDERMRVAKRKDYYKILGVAKGATDEDLKRAYRKAALQWHPDKWANSSQEEKSAAEAAFKDVQEAHSMLSDPQKRRLYDSGRMDNETEGVRGPGGGHGHGFPPGGVDISQMFSMFGGMPMGGMGGMGGGMGSGRRRGGGMPAGFQFGF